MLWRRGLEGDIPLDVQLRSRQLIVQRLLVRWESSQIEPFRLLTDNLFRIHHVLGAGKEGLLGILRISKWLAKDVLIHQNVSFLWDLCQRIITIFLKVVHKTETKWSISRLLTLNFFFVLSNRPSCSTQLSMQELVTTGQRFLASNTSCSELKTSINSFGNVYENFFMIFLWWV